MRRYAVFGVRLAAEMELELPKAAAGFGNDWKLLAGEIDTDAPSWEWYHEVTLPDGEAWARWAENRDREILIHFPRYCDFVIAPAQRSIIIARGASLQLATLQHLLIDQIVPLALALDDFLVLHASAAVRDGVAFAFLGASGQGKSTMASYLARNGWSFVTDDALRIVNDEAGLRGFPGTPRARLWPDSAAAVGQGLHSVDVAEYTYKQNVSHTMSVHDAPSVALKRIFLLGSADDVGIEPVAMRDAMMEVAASSFRVAIRDRERLAAEFRELEKLVRSGAVRRLLYPRDYGRLGEVGEALSEELYNL